VQRIVDLGQARLEVGLVVGGALQRVNGAGDPARPLEGGCADMPQRVLVPLQVVVVIVLVFAQLVVRIDVGLDVTVGVVLDAGDVLLGIGDGYRQPHTPTLDIGDGRSTGFGCQRSVNVKLN